MEGQGRQLNLIKIIKEIVVFLKTLKNASLYKKRNKKIRKFAGKRFDFLVFDVLHYFEHLFPHYHRTPGSLFNSQIVAYLSKTSKLHCFIN